MFIKRLLLIIVWSLKLNQKHITYQQKNFNSNNYIEVHLFIYIYNKPFLLVGF